MSRRGFVFHISLIVGIISSLLLPFGHVSTLAQYGSRPDPQPTQGGEKIELAVDTQDTPQDGVLALYGGIRLGGEKGLPVGAGDVNGDGRADVVFCQMYASAGVGNRRNNGQANIYISDGRDSGFVDAAQNPPNIFELIGQRPGDLLGTSVSANGDINGDGLRDIAVAAALHDGVGFGRFNAGAAYVVLGSRDFNFNADLGLTGDTPPPGVITIYGPQVDGRMGIWIDEGDVDGDGFADVVIGSDQIDAPAGEHAGGAYIVFGAANLPQVIDLAAPPAGVRTARIFGSAREEHWGAALHVGDINNDQIGDVVIGGSIYRDSGSYVSPTDQTSGHNSFGADVGGMRPGAGEVFVIYGQPNWPATIDLRTPPAGSTHVLGAQFGDLLGSQLHSGDLNGDGRNELIMGALQALAPDNRGRTGAVYVAYGHPNLQGATIDLLNPSASGLPVTTIYGENHLDCGGDSVRSFDINKDGFWDLFIGSPEHVLHPEDINGEPEREEAGDTKFIFGAAGFLPEVVKLYDPPDGVRIFRLAGGEGDEFSYRLTGADVDGDGYTDYIANAMHGDGLDNRFDNAGEAYVFSGKKLSARLGMLVTDPPPIPNIATAMLFLNGQPVQQAIVGQAGLQVRLTGTNFRADTEVTVNGVVVVNQLQGNTITINLDDNPAIRDTAGQLVVRARNTNPIPSGFSNQLTAGQLVMQPQTGPQITSINPKKKGSGQLQLRISGANFPLNGTVEVRANNQLLPLKSVSIQASDFIKVKIGAANVPASGTVLTVRVVGPTGIGSNNFTVTVP